MIEVGRAQRAQQISSKKKGEGNKGGGEGRRRGKGEGVQRDGGRREGKEREKAQARAACAHTYSKSRRKGKIKKEGERGEARVLLLYRVGAARAPPHCAARGALHLHHLRVWELDGLGMLLISSGFVHLPPLP